MNNGVKKFANELCFDAYEFLGSFLKDDTAVFRVWAPNAEKVSVVGDFNGWSYTENPMQKSDSGIWETEIYGIKQFDAYKYAVTAKNGNTVLKSDPYARHFETPPATASKVYNIGGISGMMHSGRKIAVILMFTNHPLIFMRSIWVRGCVGKTAMFWIM